MKERTKMWIDPPSGWRYGFPKIYTPLVDGDLSEWLVKQGYPADQLSSTTHVRFMDVKED